MTTAEMDYMFDVEFDSISNFSAPGYEKREKSLFLSLAQQNIYLDILNPDTPQRSTANKNELDKIILAELTKYTGDISVTTYDGSKDLPNGVFVNLPNDFFLPLNESATIEFLDTSYYYNFTNKFPSHRKKGLYVKPMTRQEYSLSVDSDIRKPNEDIVWRFEYGKYPTTYPTNNKVYELLTDGTYTIVAYQANYYRRLNDIQIADTRNSIVAVECELDPFIHKTIVRDAVNIASAAIKDVDKYKLSSAETQKNEI